MEDRRSFAFARCSRSGGPRWAAGIFDSTSSTICAAAAIFWACTAWFTKSAASRALSFDRPASSGAIVSISSTSFSDSSNRPVFAKDFTARSSIANRWTVPGSSGIGRETCALSLCVTTRPSVPRHLGLDPLRPFVDAADEVLHFAEAELSEEVRDPSGPCAGLAVHHNLVRGAQLVDPIRDLCDGHEDRVIEARDLPLRRLADIEEDGCLPRVEFLLELVGGNLELVPDLLRRAPEATEFLVVDQLLDRGVTAANRALRILPQLQLAERHAKGVEHEEAADQRVAFAEEDFDRLACLDRSHDPREDAEDAALRARGHEPGRRWFRIEAAVARPLRREEDARLTFKPENRPVDVRFVQEDGRIIHEVPCREVVRPIDDHVVVAQDVQRVVGRQSGLVGLHVDVRIDLRDPFFRDLDLLAPDVLRPIEHLALEIRLVDHVEVDDPEAADAGRAQILRERDPEAPRANDQGGRLFELQLPCHPDLREDQVPRVPLDFRGREDVLPLRDEAVHQGEGTARDARDNRDRVALVQRRRVLPEVADVFFVHVDVHEVPEVAIVGVEMPPEEIEAIDEVIEGLFDVLGLDLYHIPIADVLPERGGDDNLDRGHRRASCHNSGILKVHPSAICEPEYSGGPARAPPNEVSGQAQATLNKVNWRRDRTQSPGGPKTSTDNEFLGAKRPRSFIEAPGRRVLGLAIDDAHDDVRIPAGGLGSIELGWGGRVVRMAVVDSNEVESFLARVVVGSEEFEKVDRIPAGTIPGRDVPRAAGVGGAPRRPHLSEKEPAALLRICVAGVVLDRAHDGSRDFDRHGACSQ